MLVSVKINNCLIYNSETEFSMQANRHYKRFPNNVASFEELGVLKTAVIFGPNNAGKTNFVNILSMIKRIFLNQDAHISKNLFNPNPLCELTVSFIEKDAEYLFSAKYDAEKREYLYERFAQVHRDRYGNRKETTMLLRDSLAESYICENAELEAVMKVAAKNNLFMYLIDTSKFSKLHEIKEILTGFAGRIDIVDMNNIPIKKTIDMLKLSNQKQEKIKHFILNADISLEDFHYAGEDELKIQLSDEKHDMERKPQENSLSAAAPLMEMLHLTSVYNGEKVPSILFDSTGTKKIAALASYVIDALENNRILIIDELDNSLHFKLTRGILALFNNELNEKAQLIATVHDISLLDCKTLFRKEQIWFACKDKEHAYLYSLAEFTAEKDNIRDTSDIIEKYKKGMLGALPEPEFFESLLEVKNDVETAEH